MIESAAAVAVKGSVLVVVGWLAGRYVARTSAEWAHRVRVFACLLAFASPLLMVVPGWSLPGLIHLPLDATAEVGAGSFEGPSRASSPRSTEGDGTRVELRAPRPTPAPPDTGRSPVLSPPKILLGAWILGGLSLGGALLLSTWVAEVQARRRAPFGCPRVTALVARIFASRRTASTGGRAFPAPQVVRGAPGASPHVLGLVRPVIVLPPEAASWSDGCLEAVLAHEAGHILRRDPATLLLGRGTAALFWWHPVAHMLARDLARGAEEACDEWVVSRGADPREYGLHVLALAADSWALPRRAGSLGFRSHLERRLERLTRLRREGHRRVVAFQSLGFLLGLATWACADLARDTPELWRLEPELRIGSVNDPETALSEVGSLVVDDLGRIYVEQFREGSFFVFDSAGKRVGSIGRSGEGPGEFESIGSSGLRDGTFWATDFGLRRIERFTQDGEHLGTIPIRATWTLGGEDRVIQPVAYGGGEAVLGVVRIGANEGHDVPLVRIADPTAEPRPLAIVNRSRVSASHRMESGLPIVFPIPFNDADRWSMSPDGRTIVIASGRTSEDGDPAHFTVTRIDVETGDTLAAQTFDYLPAPFPTAAVDSVRTIWSEQLQQIGASSADIDAVIDSMALGGLQPPITDLVDTPSGQIWLRRDAVPTPEGARWWVLDLGRSAPVAEVLVPGSTRIGVVRKDRAWGVRTDSLDIPYVVRFRVERR